MKRYTKSSSYALVFLLSVSTYMPSYSTNNPDAEQNMIQEEASTTNTASSDLSVTDGASDTSAQVSPIDDSNNTAVQSSLADELSDEDELEIAQEMDDEQERTALTDIKEAFERIAISILLTGMDLQEYMAKKWNDFINPQ